MTDIAELIEPLKREVQPPGTNLFPAATDDDWLGYLQDGFWEARLDGFLAEYTISNGIVTPNLPDTLSYLIVLWAGVRITRARISNLRTAQRAVAGPTSFEFENSALVLRDVLNEIKGKKERHISRIFFSTDVNVTDAYYQRDFNDIRFRRPDEQR